MWSMSIGLFYGLSLDVHISCIQVPFWWDFYLYAGETAVAQHLERKKEIIIWLWNEPLPVQLILLPLTQSEWEQYLYMLVGR